MKDRGRIRELFGRHADGAITDEESRDLEAALRADQGLRREFLSYLNLDAALGGSTPAQRDIKAPHASRVARFRCIWRGWAAVAVVVLLSLALAWLQWPRRPRVAPPIATLAAANEAVWSDPNVELALRSGELPPGPLRLESGSAEFLCVDGATVLMRGPASVRFVERKRLFVEQGRIFCRCPSPESRLAVATPTTEVVDLGTEFAVDARADRSTLVAVLSGEVEVGKARHWRLHKGEAVEVRSDGILAIQPLAREEFSELLMASPLVGEAVRRGRNLLRDPGFENRSSDQTWSGTDANIEFLRSGGRSGGAVRIFAGGYAHWPQCRQKIHTGDIAGKLVVASVWAATPLRDPLRARQVAMLKIVFVNDQGRDFAFAMHRFVNSKSEPDQFQEGQVVAFAPSGTRQVQLQLMLNSNLLDSGSVIFDDASLVIAETPEKQ